MDPNYKKFVVNENNRNHNEGSLWADDISYFVLQQVEK